MSTYTDAVKLRQGGKQSSTSSYRRAITSPQAVPQTKKGGGIKKAAFGAMDFLASLGPKQVVRLTEQLNRATTGKTVLKSVPKATTKQVVGDIATIATTALPFGKLFSAASKLGKTGGAAARIVGSQVLGGGLAAAGAAGEGQKVTPKTVATGVAVGTALGVVGEAFGAVVAKSLKNKTANTSTIKQTLEAKSTYLEQKKPYLDRINSFMENNLPVMEKYRAQQEKLYSAERGKRFGKVKAIGEKKPGIEGFFEQKSALKGELPKVKVKPFPGISKLDVDAMLTDVTRFPTLTEGEKITAKEGLMQYFLPQTGVPKPPTEGQLIILKQVFGSRTVKNLEKARPLLQKILDAGYEIGNMPRSVMSSLDFSASFRQAFAAGVRHPVIFAKNFPKQFRYFFSEKYLNESYKLIRERPSFNIMKDVAKVEISDLGTSVGAREERFASSWIEKITGGKFSPIRASGRAYTGFLNQMRADVFDSLLKDYIKAGNNPADNPEVIRQIGKLLNAATGRGELPGKVLRESASLLNATFFSPRLIASRVHFLNPVNYIKADPFVRKEMLKTVLSMSSFATTVLGLAKAAGADVSLNIRSSDFAKIKAGKTRVDILGGFGQYLVLGGRLITGEYKSTSTGKVTKLSGKFGKTSRFDTALRFFEYKESPSVSFVSTMLKQKPLFVDNLSLSRYVVNKMGIKTKADKLNVTNEIVNRFLPMVAQDSYDLYKEYGVEALPLSILAILGMGLQTY